MVDVNHNTLTDPYLHEPKGASNAAENTTYFADGAGSGTWKKLSSYANGYIAFDAATPAYQHAVTTSFTVIDPTFSVSLASNFSGATSPNARLIYTGTDDLVATCNFTFNFKNASGTARDLEVIFYKNGSTMNGGHVVVTAESGTWASATLSDSVVLTTNDYIEIAVKADSLFTLDVAAASLIVSGVPA